jgi:hypothetical protein
VSIAARTARSEPIAVTTSLRLICSPMQAP